MSDNDPWRTPGPGQQPYQPPPQYGPAPQYGYPPYGPPGYQQPLPKRGGVRRLVWFLLVIGLLLLGGCGVGIYYLVGTVTENADAVNAFLKNVKEQQYDAAYDRLCPTVQELVSRTTFDADLRDAAASGHGVTSYDITSAETSSTNGVSRRTAAGDVNFADGMSRYITFDLRKTNRGVCLLDGQGSLVGQ